jgi:hypothetical protein
MKRYVIFHEDNTENKESFEVYAHKEQTGYLIDITRKVAEAMSFPTAREAYNWATYRGLNWWRVGAR